MTSVIEARTQFDVVGRNLKLIKFVFDSLPLPAHSPPQSFPEPGGAEDDGSTPDANCF